RRRRCRLRLCPLPSDRGRAPARDLLRRHPAGAVPAVARVPALLTRTRSGGLARLRLAGQPRVHARPAVLLPAGRGRVARRGALVVGPRRQSLAGARRRGYARARELRRPAGPVRRSGTRAGKPPRGPRWAGDAGPGCAPTATRRTPA